MSLTELKGHKSPPSVLPHQYKSTSGLLQPAQEGGFISMDFEVYLPSEPPDNKRYKSTVSGSGWEA